MLRHAMVVIHDFYRIQEFTPALQDLCRCYQLESFGKRSQRTLSQVAAAEQVTVVLPGGNSPPRPPSRE